MSDIRAYVLEHPLFCHHDHHEGYPVFEQQRDQLDYRALLGYAVADLITAAGTPALTDPLVDEARLPDLWRRIRVTGYGRAVSLASEALFGLSYEPANWPAITEALRASFAGRSAAQVYHYYVHERAQNRWTIHDGCWTLPEASALHPDRYPDSYRFTFRLDSLFAPVNAEPIQALEAFTGRNVYNLTSLVDALQAAITRFLEAGRLAALKVGMAYQRDLRVGFPTAHEAERALNRILMRKYPWDGVGQEAGAVDAATSRALGDYMLHALLACASDQDLPVQIHTGYLAGNWGNLAGTRAMDLLPILERYRSVRFDLFHASWPWTSELGTIGKNYPNVWLDLCWMWAMNPTEAERALSEWLDGVPYNKIFGYGADTRWPWCNVGYSLQAKLGIARVLEAKIAAGYLSPTTAREVADAILLGNGEAFYGLGG